MKDAVWRVCILIALACLFAWVWIGEAKSDERYRMLMENEVRRSTIEDRMPEMIAIAIQRHHQKMIAYLEGRDQDE